MDTMELSFNFVTSGCVYAFDLTDSNLDDEIIWNQSALKLSRFMGAQGKTNFYNSLSEDIIT